MYSFSYLEPVQIGKAKFKYMKMTLRPKENVDRDISTASSIEHLLHAFTDG